MFRLFYGNCTYEDWLSLCVGCFYFLNDSIPFVFFVEVNFVVFVDTCNRKVCWNCNYVQLVNLSKFNCFCLGSTCHTGKFFVHTEEVLECNCCHCTVSLCDVNVLFCFDCLVQSVRITAAFKNTACKFVNNLNLTVFYYVVNVVFVKKVSADCLSKVVQEFKVLFVLEFCIRSNEIVFVENFINVVHTLVGK